jgi:hypothetical protein
MLSIERRLAALEADATRMDGSLKLVMIEDGESESSDAACQLRPEPAAVVGAQAIRTLTSSKRQRPARSPASRTPWAAVELSLQMSGPLARERRLRERPSSWRRTSPSRVAGSTVWVLLLGNDQGA